jgi:SOS-response transcriptional repressor LexA
MNYSPQAQITARQLQVFSFIQTFRRQAGRLPSFQQIADEIGVASVSTAFEHVRALQKKGWLPVTVRSSAAYHRAG